MIKLLQCNLNHSWGAHDILSQHMLEMEIGICTIAEPVQIPKSASWAGSKNGKAAIRWNPSKVGRSGTIVDTGEGYVAVCFGTVIVMSCYISPNISREEYLEFLDELDAALRNRKFHKIVVCGDFNAKSVLWGSSRTDSRGALLEEWAAENELRLVNVGCEPTCIRPQGMSCVDLTWASPELASSIREWKVLSMETLSDHVYIYMEVGEIGTVVNRAKLGWKWDKADVDLFQASLVMACATMNPTENRTVDDMETQLGSMLRRSCDLAAPRRGKPPNKRNCHWWSVEISELRKASVKRRREWQRGKRRGSVTREELSRLEDEYRSAKRALRRAISKAKLEAWQELINLIEKDPWGMPYRIVMRRLDESTGRLTEKLDEPELKKMLDSLFPSGESYCQGSNADEDEVEQQEADPREERETTVTSLEVIKTIKRPKAGNPAPGVDGITPAILKRLPSEMVSLMAKGYTRCLKEGVFPKNWKKATLVLIPKPGGDSAPGITKARPICLLSELGKTLERVIVERLLGWMRDNPVYELAETQFGFRKGKSTCDALILVKRIIKAKTEAGGVTIAVSLDIKNAFNSIPWDRIIIAMERKGFPMYLRNIIRSYLSERSIEYPIMGGGRGSRPVEAGVPQGSVLGPLLWNIAFDSVVNVASEPGCRTVCYADDTMVLASAVTVDSAVSRANLQVDLVLKRIRRLGLVVSAEKTEVVLFPGKTKIKAEDFPEIQVGEVTVKATTSMKYLGIILDSRLRFLEHFKYVEGKAAKVTRALGRLMPNLRGPHERKRRLYAEVLQSVILYAAPVWSDELKASRVAQRFLDRIVKTMALRVVAAYRTVSLDAAGVLGRIPPTILAAATRKRTYERIKDLKEREDWSGEAERAIRKEELLLMRRQWELFLQRTNAAGKRTTEAILPNLCRWLDRPHGGMTFHLTQLMSGHGCFASYLFRIGKAESPGCNHCTSGQTDTPEHTLQECGAWDAHRARLREVVGQDNNLTLSAIVAEICGSPEAWAIFSCFASTVMQTKEKAEREREMARSARASFLP